MLRALLLAATLASPVAAEPCATPPYPTEIAALLDALAPAAAEFPGLLAALDDGVTEICLLPGLMTVRGFLDTDLDRISTIQCEEPGSARRP